MHHCRSCGVGMPAWDEARYDVFRADASEVDPAELGPYCAECFADTVTGTQIARNAEVDR